MIHTCKVYPLGTCAPYRYVVIFSKYHGKWLFSRHKNRLTWETQGGHIEANETPLDAAKRELYEESGAKEFTITPLFDYDAADESSSAAGVVFLADIRSMDPLPNYEMQETRQFASLPTDLTYPAITPVLFEALMKQ